MINYLLSVIFSFISSSVSAQDFNFDRAYQDYTFNKSKYIEVYSDYKKAKDTYQKNETLNLKEDARAKTYLMLIQREEMLKTYLTALKMRIFENKGLTDSEKGAEIKKLDTEIVWLTNQKDKYKSNDTAEDLFNKSKETEARYKSNILPSSYETMFNVSYGDLVDNKNANLNIYDDLKKYINKGVSDNKFKIDPFDRWFLDIENAEKMISTTESLAKEKALKLATDNYSSPIGAFNSAIETLKENITNLDKLNGFMFELLNAIRAQEKLSK